jgi:four helix bundle protein
VAGVSRYEDLVVWQLANELQRAVFELTATGPASRDFKFRDQVRDSAASVTRNVAEGFGRFGDAEFACFLRVARGSLTETHNSLRDGHDRGYFTATEMAGLQHLAIRAIKAATGLIRCLDPPGGKNRRRLPRAT